MKGGSVTARNAWCFRRGTIEVFTISDFDIGKIIKISLQVYASWQSVFITCCVFVINLRFICV